MSTLVDEKSADQAACCEPTCCADVAAKPAPTATTVDLKDVVKARYGEVAEGTATCGSLCGCTDNAETLATAMGYSAEELAALPEGANLGLSCGNPQALAAIAPGEVVVDLGSGAGFDALIAARKVGPGGKVIGVDMTAAMLAKARANAAKAGLDAIVEFREGDLETLPIDDDSVDVVLSNCVLNLVPDKDAAFREIVRVLKPGGRLSVSDMAWEVEPSEATRRDLEALVGCVGGALVLDDYVARLERAGFRSVQVERHPTAVRAMIDASGVQAPAEVERHLSVTITARK